MNKINWNFDNTYFDLSNSFKENINPVPVKNPELVLLKYDKSHFSNVISMCRCRSATILYPIKLISTDWKYDATPFTKAIVRIAAGIIIIKSLFFFMNISSRTGCINQALVAVAAATKTIQKIDIKIFM